MQNYLCKKHYSLAVNTFSSTGKLSRKNIVLSYNRPPLPPKSTEAVSNRDFLTFEEKCDNVGSDDMDPLVMVEEHPEHSVSSCEKRRTRKLIIGNVCKTILLRPTSKDLR